MPRESFMVFTLIQSCFVCGTLFVSQCLTTFIPCVCSMFGILFLPQCVVVLLYLIRVILGTLSTFQCVVVYLYLAYPFMFDTLSVS